MLRKPPPPAQLAVREIDISAALEAQLEKRGLGQYFWRMNTGAARRRLDDGRLGQKIQFGRKGQADWTGIAPDWTKCPGRRVEIETKATHPDGCGCDSCSAQRAFGEIIRSAGGLYLFCRVLPAALAILDRELGL